MNPFSRIVKWATFGLVVLVLFMSCQNDLAINEIMTGSRSAYPEISQPLTAGQHIPAGSVSISRDESTLYLTYSVNENYLIKETHVWVGTQVDSVPKSKGGLVHGKFGYGEAYPDGVRNASVAIPIIWPDGSDLVVFAHAELKGNATGVGDESAYAGTLKYSGVKRWNYYFAFSLPFLTYSVLYDGNGNTSGTPPVDSNAYRTGDLVTVQDNTGNLGRTDFVFTGWNTAPDGNGTDYLPGSEYSTGSEDVVFYAQWEEDKYFFISNLDSDPGLVTNNPENMKLLPDGTLFLRNVNINAGGEYAYFDTKYRGGSFILEWDIMMLSCDYAASIVFGLFDTDLNLSDNGSNLNTAFVKEDRGQQIFLEAINEDDFVVNDWEAHAQFSFGCWYRVSMNYNAATGTITGITTDKSTNEIIDINTIHNAGSFATDMNRLGFSNIRIGNYQSPGSTATAVVDNIVMYRP